MADRLELTPAPISAGDPLAKGRGKVVGGAGGWGLTGGIACAGPLWIDLAKTKRLPGKRGGDQGCVVSVSLRSSWPTDPRGAAWPGV